MIEQIRRYVARRRQARKMAKLRAKFEGFFAGLEPGMYPKEIAWRWFQQLEHMGEHEVRHRLGCSR